MFQHHVDNSPWQLLAIYVLLAVGMLTRCLFNLHRYGTLQAIAETTISIGAKTAAIVMPAQKHWRECRQNNPVS